MRLIEQLFRLLTPSECFNCGNEGSLLCMWCREEALLQTESRCFRCNALSINSKTCTNCRRHTVIAHLWSRTEYTDIARKLVHAMKFKYSQEATQVIADELMNTIPSMDTETLIVPVPTITSHVRERGFDHTKVMSEMLARKKRILLCPALRRLGQSHQVGAERHIRLSQVQGSFYVTTAKRIKNAYILLVDDVITTGATLEEAARTLKAAGAKRVDAVVFAKAK